MMTLRRVLAPVSVALVLAAAPGAAQSPDSADWAHVDSEALGNDMQMDTSTIREADGGHRVWLRVVFDREYSWPNTDVMYNAMYYDRLYRCDARQWVTKVHSAWLNGRMVRRIPNPFADFMNDGTENEARLFRSVCERIRARAPARPAATRSGPPRSGPR